MSDIPPDVMEVARKTIRSSFSLEMGGFEMFNEAYATEQVARAILAERRRHEGAPCAVCGEAPVCSRPDCPQFPLEIKGS